MWLLAHAIWGIINLGLATEFVLQEGFIMEAIIIMGAITTMGMVVDIEATMAGGDRLRHKRTKKISLCALFL